MSAAITAIGTALTGIVGYFDTATTAFLGNDMWLLGMGFFVLTFLGGFLHFLFRIGRR